MTKWFVKLLVSFIMSFTILNLICLIYYNVPKRMFDKEGVTDYKWPSNTFYSRLTEGMTFGRTNNDGYNNLIDYDKNVYINNLLMGSSHVEGFCLKQEDTISNLLNNFTNTFTYNIGVSMHTLPICLSNLENALRKYKPHDNVIIETMTLSFNDSQLEDSINNNIQLETYSDKYIDFLQNFKYLKLVYYQISNLKKLESINSMQNSNNEKLLNDVLSKAKTECDKYNVNLIIVYHPSIIVDSNNVALTNYNTNDLYIFQKVCLENNIIFINMEYDFINNYYQTNKLPHGFINTKPGVGHLNKYGSRMIADRLKEIIE